MSKNSKETIKGLKISSEKNSQLGKKIKNITDFKEEIEKSSNQDVSSLLEKILVGSIILESSDVHIEPEKNIIKIRIRIDGFLQEAATIERHAFEGLLSRIKFLSGIKLNVTDRPQDGRFSVLIEETLTDNSPNLPPLSASQSSAIEIRVSSLPAEHGESIVLRILNPKNLIEIENLGLNENLKKLVEKEIKKPNGMIIVTGPTGSGKTTTLYAILKKINKPEIKIITIEDPIEYHLEGISQTQVDSKKGYSFASGLKSIVRQDPDIVLVGEIRDLETAEIACQAALTGHLVFSTLHTNDAAGAIARLIDLGVKSNSISPAINMIVAQRLPRKVCKECVKFEKPSTETLETLKKELSSLKKELSSLKIPKAVGCKECNFIGYRRRIGIYEIFLIDDEMESFILRNDSTALIRKEALRKGMISMREDGLTKVIQGLTTIEEINRVAGE